MHPPLSLSLTYVRLLIRHRCKERRVCLQSRAEQISAVLARSHPPCSVFYLLESLLTGVWCVFVFARLGFSLFLN